MKIAIESNDGETINSPFDKPKGYLVFDVEETGIKDTHYIKLQTTGKKPQTVSSGKTKNIKNCSQTVKRFSHRLQIYTSNIFNFDYTYNNNFPVLVEYYNQ